MSKSTLKQRLLWNAGDIQLLPKPEPGKKYSPEQERDWHGRWSTGDTSDLTGGKDPPNLPAAAAEKNMVDLYSRAVASGKADDYRQWYSQAHDQCVVLAGQLSETLGHKVDPSVLMGMVAASSTQTAWDYVKSPRMPNLEFAINAALISDPDKVMGVGASKTPLDSLPADKEAMKAEVDSWEHPGTLSPNIVGAVRIYRGEEPGDVLSGPKTRSFYNNILEPDGPRDVTVDTHMVRAMANDATLGKNDEGKGVSDIWEGVGSGAARTGGYGWTADRVRAAAAEAGVSPANEFQAAVWMQWRVEHP